MNLVGLENRFVPNFQDHRGICINKNRRIDADQIFGNLFNASGALTLLVIPLYKIG